jgi:dTDP-glucose 4,6-dehydratase
MEMGTLIFDIDGTLCTQEKNYADAKPIYSVIDKLNKKYDEGYKIVLFTARGTETGIDWREITE